MKSRFFLAIDIGTSGCKVALVNSEGKIVRKIKETYEVFINGHKVEQSPEDWWLSTVKAIRKVMTGHDKKSVEAVCVAGQSPVVLPIGRDGKPLSRAILWMDRRAIKQADLISEVSGWKADPSEVIPKILWLRDNKPELYRRTAAFLQASDYINYRLTGRIVTDHYTALTSNYDIDRGEWPHYITELEINDLLPRVCKPGEIIGQISEEASKNLGLERDVKVVVGSIDAFTATLGSGLLSPRDACDITGTSTCLFVVTKRRVLDSKARILTVPHFIEGLNLSFGMISTSGALVDWLVKLMYHREKEPYKVLTEEAENSPPGSNGLVVIPHFAGSRTPSWDPDMRGLMAGLTLSHKRGDIARGIFEGCAFALKHVVNHLEKGGVLVGDIRAGGQGSTNTFWCKLKASITGRTYLILNEPDVTLLGCGILAMYATGYYKSLEEAMKLVVRIAGVVKPDKKLMRTYGEVYRTYLATYNWLVGRNRSSG